MKHMNTIAIQTETSESENFNLADIKKLKCFQNKNNINSKTKQPRLTALKEKSISHQKIGEIPKYEITTLIFNKNLKKYFIIYF